MSVESNIESLLAPELGVSIHGALMTWPDVQTADADRVTKWALALRDDLVNLIREIGDPDEVKMTLAINYIELKSRWIALNTKMNYQTFRTGSCDTITALRGAALSAVVGKVEELLTQNDIEEITQFLSEPIRRAA
jgi:hypothetical protein